MQTASSELKRVIRESLESKLWIAKPGESGEKIARAKHKNHQKFIIYLRPDYVMMKGSPEMSHRSRARLSRSLLRSPQVLANYLISTYTISVLL